MKGRSTRDSVEHDRADQQRNNCDRDRSDLPRQRFSSTLIIQNRISGQKMRALQRSRIGGIRGTEEISSGRPGCGQRRDRDRERGCTSSPWIHHGDREAPTPRARSALVLRTHGVELAKESSAHLVTCELHGFGYSIAAVSSTASMTDDSAVAPRSARNHCADCHQKLTCAGLGHRRRV
jgi:hypothetical protein